MKPENVALLLILWVNFLALVATLLISPEAISMLAAAIIVFLIYLPIWCLLKWEERHGR